MNFRRLGQYICTLGLAAMMSVSTMGAVTISDVANSHWAYTAISDLEERGVMVLSSNGQFHPNQTMNYFEVADVLAKATGYVDVEIATNISDSFKEQIKKNYAAQKATLEAYAKKYSTWNSAYNQQIAYLLGRGYMQKSDLDQFITKTSSGETKNIVTKEQLSVYIVRMLGKEVTAKKTYKTTTFKDDNTLKAETKPYVAYLNEVGIIKPDAAGKANGTMKVTKALCAKMVSDALKIEDTTTVGKVENSTTNTTQGTANTSGTYTVGKILTKNNAEYYILLEDASGNKGYYSFKAETKIYDATGQVMDITKLTAGTKVEVSIGLQGNFEYITSIKVSNMTTDSNIATNETNQNANNQNTTVENINTVSGTLLSSIANEVVRIGLADGTSTVYLIDDNCTVILDGAAIKDTKALKAGDTILLTLNNSAVTKIVATSSKVDQTTSGAVSSISEGEITAKKYLGNGYLVTIKQGSVEQQVTIPTSAKLTRNNRKSDMSNIRIGDTVKLTRENGAIKALEATGTKTKIEGNIKQITIGSTTKIVVDVKGEEHTYTVTGSTEVYDNSKKEYSNVRNLHIGEEVTIVLESKEVVSIDIDESATNYKLMGVITDIGKNGNYMDVLVDYDYTTGESKVYKRIELNGKVPVVINGKTKDRYELEEDMHVVITYKYVDDTTPEKILVIE